MLLSSFWVLLAFFFSVLALPVVNIISVGYDISNSFRWVLTFPYSPKLCTYLHLYRFAYSVPSFFSLLSPSHSPHIFCFPYKVLFLFFWLQKPINLSSFISNVSFIFHDDISEATAIL